MMTLKDKSIDYLEGKRKEFVELMDKFNNETKVFIKRIILTLAIQNRKVKKDSNNIGIPHFRMFRNS